MLHRGEKPYPRRARRPGRRGTRWLLGALVSVASLVAITPSGVSASGALPHPGDRSSAVATLQRALLDQGVAVRGGADGRYGPATAAAVASFQASRGLPSTGVVDRATAQALGLLPADPLASGARGPAVVALQRQLIAVGSRPLGGADGVYGPATARAVRRFQGWMGLPRSGRVDAATATALAKSAGTAVGVVVAPSAPRELARFPLPRTCAFWDTWHAARFGGHVHEGTDVFARRGTKVYAVADGRITSRRFDQPGSRGGNQLWLTADDGTRYFYAHLDGFARRAVVGARVRAGTVLGVSGATGLVSAPHLHFEIHPHGGHAVDPYLTLRVTAGCPASGTSS